MAAKLRPDELEHVIRLVSRCPSCYPPGTLDALKSKRMASLTPTAGSPRSYDQRRGRCSSAHPTQAATCAPRGEASDSRAAHALKCSAPMVALTATLETTASPVR